MSKNSNAIKLINLSKVNKISFLFKDSILYGFLTATSKALTLITFPIIVRFFSVKEYGQIDYLNFLAGFGATLFIFGQDSAVSRFFYQYEDVYIRKQLITQSLIFQISCIFFVLPFVLIFENRIFNEVLNLNIPSELLNLTLFQIPFLLLLNFSQNILKWTFSRKKFLIISIGQMVLYTVILLLGVLNYNFAVYDVLKVSFFVNLIFATIGIYFVREWLSWPKNFNYLREMVVYALPFGLICLIGSASPVIDRTLIINLIDSLGVGIFAVANKIAMLSSLVVSSFQVAWGPFSISLYKRKDSHLIYNKVLIIFTFLVCIFTLIITLSIPFLIKLLNKNVYQEAGKLVFPLMLGIIFQAISWITEIGISISKKSYLILYANIIGIVTSFIGMWFLGKILGLFGITLAILIGQMIKSLIVSWLAQNVYPINWDFRNVLLIIFITMVGGFSSIYTSEINSYSFSSLIIVLTIISLLFYGWFFLFDTKDIKRLVFKIKKKIGITI